MESGRTHMFRYDLQGSGYQVAPYYSDGDYLEVDLETMQSDQLLTDSGAQAGSEEKQDELPEGISFHGVEAAADARAAALDESLLSVGTLGQQWSTPILFYADGTSMTAQVTMTNRRGNFVIAKLRGLTGMATVGELLAPEELPQ